MPDENLSSNLGANLEIDLALTFGPAWAREGDSKERLERLARQHGGGEDDRPRRGGKGGRDFGPSDRERRPPKRDSKGSAPRRHDNQRSDRPERSERREPQRESELTGWEIKFTPDRHGVEGLAKQIKTSGRAYPLFDLARLVLDKSERYVVDFRKAEEEAQPLWQVKTDGTLWLSESDAISQAVAASLDRLYRREQTTIEPPKGNIQIVGVCGMSGTLLGPPTHHDYPAKIARLYKERFSHVPFETYKSRIRMERDEALIEKWKEQESTRDVYYPIPAEPEPAIETPASAEPATEPEPVAETASAPETSAATEPLPEPTPFAEGDVPAEVPVEDVAPAAPEHVESETAVPEEAPAESATPEVPAGDALKSMAEVERHFREHHAAQEVTAIRQKVTVPGPAAVNDSAAPIVAFTRRILDELERFPLPTAQILAHQLTPQGLHIFKTPDRITHIGVARPRFLDLENTSVSDPLLGMLRYLSERPDTPRADQWKSLVALRTEPDPEAAAARDLRWLMLEGYVIDFVKTGISVVPRPVQTEKPKKPAQPQKPVETKTAPPADEGVDIKTVAPADES